MLSLRQTITGWAATHGMHERHIGALQRSTCFSISGRT
jgi:hypothetical protein